MRLVTAKIDIQFQLYNKVGSSKHHVGKVADKT